MAKPSDSYPKTATLGAGVETRDGDEPSDKHQRIGEYDSSLETLVTNDQLKDVLTTAILIISSADETEIEHVTDSTVNLIEAVDGLSTAEAAELATDLGDNADDFSATLETVAQLQRDGNLDDIIMVATAFSDSLSPSEVEKLATTIEENGSEAVDALDVVLEMQQSGELEELVELSRTLSSLEVDDESVAGLNNLLSAMGEAEQTSRPVGVVGFLTRMRDADVKAGLGYLLSLLKALGRKTSGR